jgi:hypothetical protein
LGLGFYVQGRGELEALPTRSSAYCGALYANEIKAVLFSLQLVSTDM